MNRAGWLFRVHVSLVAISTSYLTLGLSDAALAQSLWAVYAIASGVLATLSLALGKTDD